MMNGENGGAWNFDPSKVTDLSDWGLPGAFFVPTSKGGGVIQHTATGDGTPAPDGYVKVSDGKGGEKYLRTRGAKTIPPSAQNQLTQYLNDYSSANDILNSSDDELKNNPAGLPPAQLKASAQARLKRVQMNAQNLLNLQHKLGALDDDTHQSFLQQFGLAKPSAPASGAGSGAAASGERITVWKDGKQFTVPASQKDDAVKAGYSLTK
jgi:hypothetical protein